MDGSFAHLIMKRQLNRHRSYYNPRLSERQFCAIGLIWGIAAFLLYVVLPILMFLGYFG